MIELPEAVNIAGQINNTIYGKRIASVMAVHTPHKLACYYGEPATYADLLTGRTIGETSPLGNMVEIKLENANILFGESVGITVSKPCPVCGTMIKREAYMGGSVYYCEKYQRL